MAEFLRGSNALIEHKGLQFRVKIIKTKQAYGHTRYNVRPLSGYGTAWVQELIKLEYDRQNKRIETNMDV